jgi:hypothetical protein
LRLAVCANEGYNIIMMLVFKTVSCFFVLNLNFKIFRDISKDFPLAC